MMRTPLIAGNWKMNGTSQTSQSLLSSLKDQAQAMSGVDLVVFPPFPYLALTQSLLSDTLVSWGAQNMSDQPDGAFTGEVSATMLLDLGCQYVILGHSERRHLLGESNNQVARKVKAALSAGLNPILCVGETLADRESGQTWPVIQEQLAEVFRLKDNLLVFDKLIVAYEPVWAIGTGKVADLSQIEAVHEAIRSYSDMIQPEFGQRMRILYGGSVKPENARSLLKSPQIDGALVGGASLDTEQFLTIVKAAI